MNDKERYEHAESYHALVAIRRNKENPDRKELCFRKIVRDFDVDLAVLRSKAARYSGIWRIYQTISKRRTEPARKLLMKYLIDDPDKFAPMVDILWKSCLLKKECREKKTFLIDIDIKMTNEELYKFISDHNIETNEIIDTPNGHHIVCDTLDTRKLQGIEGVSVKRDSYKFIERLEILNDQ